MLSLSISTAGVWSCPATTGERPPPCAAFTFTAVDDRRAVLFGGVNGDQGCMNDVYIIDLLTMVHTYDSSHTSSRSPSLTYAYLHMYMYSTDRRQTGIKHLPIRGITTVITNGNSLEPQVQLQLAFCMTMIAPCFYHYVDFCLTMVGLISNFSTDSRRPHLHERSTAIYM